VRRGALASMSPVVGREVAMRGYRAPRHSTASGVSGRRPRARRRRTIIGVEPACPAPADCHGHRPARATLLPGLIDAHTHLCGDSGRARSISSPNWTTRDRRRHRRPCVHLQSGVTAGP
jgi:hypothetical protein